MLKLVTILSTISYVAACDKDTNYPHENSLSTRTMSFVAPSRRVVSKEVHDKRNFDLRVNCLKKTISECEKKSPALSMCFKAFLGDENNIIDVTSHDVLSAMTRLNIRVGSEDIGTLLKKFYKSDEFKAQSKSKKEGFPLTRFYKETWYIPSYGIFEGEEVPFVE